uniref:Uncharacterized protein n=1 Tax=Nelumbo nucifera TaxID=4432 RepID=A0A822YH46_NELNU|nr:TPA_asm: hypothetical protein HUJ06_009632 [Nelumbo nucifera]
MNLYWNSGNRKLPSGKNLRKKRKTCKWVSLEKKRFFFFFCLCRNERKDNLSGF